jgi:hypothetical protein
MLRLWWLAMCVGIAALIVSGIVASLATAQSGGDPVAVITAFEAARNRGDLDAALAYFTDDATVAQRNATFSGKDDLRKFLEGASTRARFVVVSDRHSSGNRVMWDERAAAPAGSPRPGQPNQVPGLNNVVANDSRFVVSVDAIVQDGKIRSLSYQTANAPSRPDPSLDGRAQLPATVGLGAVLAVLLGALMLASSGIGRASMGASTLRGRLMEDLQGWSAARQ